jgi:hypothetical protein
MEYARQALIKLYALFEGLENIGAAEPYIISMADEFQKLVNVIRYQDQQIQELRAELEMANSVFATLNTDVIHMRSTLSNVLHPTKPKKIEELV